jgi:hypothetical protein
VGERGGPGASDPTCHRGCRRDQAPVVQGALLVAASVIGKTLTVLAPRGYPC